jgi:predicted  nucleic acid-binding Zn-ribbon protein
MTLDLENKKDFFRQIKEIYQLKISINRAKQSIKEELSRLEKVQSLQNQREFSKENDLKNLKNIREQLLLKQKRDDEVRSQLTSQHKAAQSDKTGHLITASQNKIQELNNELKSIESDSLSFLEQEEILENSIKDHDEFLKGINKTLHEIKEEVLHENEAKHQEIKTLNERIELLLQAMPTGYQEILKTTFSLKLAQSPFSSIEKLRCQICQYSINRALEVLIEENYELKSCPNCRRIFIPNFVSL